MGQFCHRNCHFLAVITICALPASLMASRSASITHEGGRSADPARSGCAVPSRISTSSTPPTGHIWGRKEIAIPISAVTGVDNGIRLNITKKQVEELPPAG
jgi:hypothetical protein